MFMSLNVDVLDNRSREIKPKSSPALLFGVDNQVCFEPNHVDGLVQERRNSSAFAMELRLSCTDPWMWND